MLELTNNNKKIYKFWNVPRLYYSAFSMGSDLYSYNGKITSVKKKLDGDIETITQSEKEQALKIYNSDKEKYTSLNPSSYFEDLINDINGSKKSVKINNNKGANNNPRKNDLINAMNDSDFIYMATHGSASGLWIQDIILDENGAPTLMYILRKVSKKEEFIRLEFEAKDSTKDSRISAEDVTNLKNDLRLKWMIIAGCAQLGESAGEDLGIKWAKAILKNKTVHGILGYYGSAPGYTRQNDIVKRFVDNVKSGNTILKAWENANDRLMGDSTWMAVYHESNENDILKNLFANHTSDIKNSKIYREGYKKNKEELNVN